MASIWAYMHSLLEYIVNFIFVWLYPLLLTLYVQYTKNPGVKKWLPFELICSVYLEYIVPSNSYFPLTLSNCT